MVKFTEHRSLWYDDVVLIAQPGQVVSRQDIPIEGYRIVVSAMTSIVGPDFLRAVAKLPMNLRPTIHIPRDQYAEEHIKLARELELENIIVGVGLNTPHLEALAKDNGYNNLLIDVANGYHPKLKEKIVELVQQGFLVTAGSVHTKEGALDLVAVGVNMVRLSIGSGSACITKDKTGYTRGTITEILDARRLNMPINILADGGISSSGDVAKAFLCGATHIMSGRLFVDAAEARMRMDGTNLYYGMASQEGKRSMKNNSFFIEGKADILSRENVRPLEQILRELWDGIRSAVSYSGYRTLSEAIGHGVFEIKGR